MAISTCVLFLLSIVTIQFMLIYHLSNQCPQLMPESSGETLMYPPPQYSAVPPCVCKACPTCNPPLVQEFDVASAVSPAALLTPHTDDSPAVHHINCDNSSNTRNSNSIGNRKHYSGIALTLMLHTPTWFQRRYSMMVLNILNNLPDDWAVQIVTTGKGQSKNGIEINLGLKRLVESGKILEMRLPEAMGKIKRFEIMLSRYLWEHIPADKVIIFGGNQVICSNSPFQISNFAHLDYVGAPWNFANGLGGEGGISLRSRKMMLAAIDYELLKVKDPEKKKTAHLNWGQEDQFYVSRLLEMRDKNVVMAEYPDIRFNEIKLATREETRMFASTNNYVNSSSFTCANTLGAATFEERDLYISFCPEIKMVFPSLHDPSCFGAAPNGTECAKTICALKVPRRKGGC